MAEKPTTDKPKATLLRCDKKTELRIGDLLRDNKEALTGQHLTGEHLLKALRVLDPTLPPGISAVTVKKLAARREVALKVKPRKLTAKYRRAKDFRIAMKLLGDIAVRLRLNPGEPALEMLARIIGNPFSDEDMAKMTGKTLLTGVDPLPPPVPVAMPTPAVVTRTHLPFQRPVPPDINGALPTGLHVSLPGSPPTAGG